MGFLLGLGTDRPTSWAPGSFQFREIEFLLFLFVSGRKGERSAVSQQRTEVMLSEESGEGSLYLVEELPRSGPGSYLPSSQAPLSGT